MNASMKSSPSFSATSFLGSLFKNDVTWFISAGLLGYLLGRLIGLDLVNQPDLATIIASAFMGVGIVFGLFAFVAYIGSESDRQRYGIEPEVSPALILSAGKLFVMVAATIAFTLGG